MLNKPSQATVASFSIITALSLLTLGMLCATGEMFLTDTQYMVAIGRWILANGQLPTTDPLTVHENLHYVCQQWPICLAVATLYDTLGGEFAVRVAFCLLDYATIILLWYLTLPKDNSHRIVHCIASSFISVALLIAMRSTPRALDTLCIAATWLIVEKFITSNSRKPLCLLPFIGILIANLHGALWPCAIMAPLSALFDSRLTGKSRESLFISILVTVLSCAINFYGIEIITLPFQTVLTKSTMIAAGELSPLFSFAPTIGMELSLLLLAIFSWCCYANGFKETLFRFETLMLLGTYALTLSSYRNILLFYSTLAMSLRLVLPLLPKRKPVSRYLTLAIATVGICFAALTVYPFSVGLNVLDSNSLSLDFAYAAMKNNGAKKGAPVFTDFDPGTRAELYGYRPYLDTRVEIFGGMYGSKNVIQEARCFQSGKHLEKLTGTYRMHYAILSRTVNKNLIGSLSALGWNPIYQDTLYICLKSPE